MISVFRYPSEEAARFLATLAARATGPDTEVLSAVAEILAAVRRDGDRALLAYSLRFDGAAPSEWELDKEALAASASTVPSPLYGALSRAANHIRAYHEKQLAACGGGFSLTREGVALGGRVLPMQRAGIYVPGGTAAYPSSVLMCAIPARVAGVREILMVTPPRRGEAGLIDPAIAAAAQIAGVDRVFCVGGAQAIAALAYGTETIPRADIICGPGNIYVTTAKKLVFGDCAIDMLAGPSEILILADESANPDFLAADLLSQAEHDKSASSLLLTNSPALAEATKKALGAQLSKLSREAIAAASIRSFGAILLCENMEEALALSNALAPEHLELCVSDPHALLAKVQNAGSVFLGGSTPEPVGDYYAGANHVLPTMGGARFSSPLGVYHFLKRQSTICYDRTALMNEADDILTLARAEGLSAHAASIEVRKNT